MGKEPELQEAESTLPLMDLNLTPIQDPEGGVFMEYANVVNVDWTLYDVQLHFGELMQFPDGENSSWKARTTAILDKASITIPWHQAKYLANLLSAVVHNYEEINGELKPIKLPAAP